MHPLCPHSLTALSAFLFVLRAGQQLGEYALVHDMLLVCQGLNGTYIKYNGREGAFAVAAEFSVSPSQAALIRDVAHSGLLFDRIRSFVDNRQADRGYGLIGKVWLDKYSWVFLWRREGG